MRTYQAALIVALTIGCTAEARSQVLVSCDPQLKWGYVTEQALLPEKAPVVMQGPTRTLDSIDTSDFVVMSKEDSQGNASRVGSKSTKRNCGPFTVMVRADWFNANPMGERGADDFPVIEIWRKDKRMLGPVALGSCDQHMGRSWGECPKDWATSITFMWQREPAFFLTHAYEELRREP